MLRNIFTVGFATSLTRLLGFVRDMLIAMTFGVSVIADAFIVAFRLPNLLRRVYAEGALNAGFIPSFEKVKATTGNDEALRFSSEIYSGFTWLVLIVLAIFLIFTPQLIALFAPGFTGDMFELTVLLTRISIFFLLFSSMAAVLAGLLNARGAFIATSFAPLTLNLVMPLVLGLALYWGNIALPRIAFWLAISVSIAGFLQFLWLVLVLRAQKSMLALTFPRWNERVKACFWLAAPALIASSVAQLNVLLGTIIASLNSSGVAYLYYADRLYQLPLGILSVALGVVMLSDMAKDWQGGLISSVIENHKAGLILAFALAIPSAIGLYMGAEAIISTLFERGAFGANESRVTALVLKALAIGLPSFVAIKVTSNVFFAKMDNKTPLIAALLGFLVNGIASYLLHLRFGVIGVAYATSLSGFVSLIYLWVVLARQNLLQFTHDFYVSIFKIVGVSLIMALILWFSPFLLHLTPLKFVNLGFYIGFGMIVYCALIWFSRALPLDLLRLKR